jgi:hypothetical protein
LTNVDDYEGGQLPRPARIIVYDFAVTPADLPEWAVAGADLPQAAADPEDVEAGRKVGAALAKELVEKLNQMGMTAVGSENQPGPQLGDLAIAGYFASIDKGSAVERVVIGFGKGDAEVKAHVEGYRSTADGMQRLGSADLDAGGSTKTPGMVVPALVTVATHNPIGLVVGGAVKAEGEVSGRSTDEGSAERIADEIAKHLKTQFQKQGWISSS